ncbi:M23 family metallopeptidase [candidate division KSB1 bacterium]|nr:M23 family metallopeptidase [candidate division KSB1 bacterium]
MRDKRIKLIYFSLGGSEVKYIELSWAKVFALASVVILIIAFIIGSSIGLFTDYYQDFRIKSLNNINSTLRSQLKDMRQNVMEFQNKMAQLEVNDNEERVIAGLGKIDKDIREVGVGGTAIALTEETSLLPRGTQEELLDTRSIIGQLERRIQLLIDSKGEIDNKLKDNQLKLKHTPSIRPVRGGKLTDSFGWRLDPFIERIKMHNGIDIAAQEGTPIYASAAGVVEFAKSNYRPNKGYGMEIVVDHGNGVKTRYAHLSKISVNVGQKVNRWDIIGRVGETGRATGPHLHYEVLVNGKHVDPLQYILE